MPGTLPAQNVGQVVRKRLADGTYMYEERASSNGDVYNEIHLIGYTCAVRAHAC